MGTLESAAKVGTQNDYLCRGRAYYLEWLHFNLTIKRTGFTDACLIPNAPFKILKLGGGSK